MVGDVKRPPAVCPSLMAGTITFPTLGRPTIPVFSAMHVVRLRHSKRHAVTPGERANGEHHLACTALPHAALQLHSTRMQSVHDLYLMPRVCCWPSWLSLAGREALHALPLPRPPCSCLLPSVAAADDSGRLREPILSVLTVQQQVLQTLRPADVRSILTGCHPASLSHNLSAADVCVAIENGVSDA